jgi:hypothetical protein
MAARRLDWGRVVRGSAVRMLAWNCSPAQHGFENGSRSASGAAGGFGRCWSRVGKGVDGQRAALTPGKGGVAGVGGQVLNEKAANGPVGDSQAEFLVPQRHLAYLI